MQDKSTPSRLDQTRAVSDARDGLTATSHLGNATLSDVRHLNPLTRPSDHLPSLLIDEHTHTVQKRETLSQIAQHHLGKGATVHDIYNYVNELTKLNHLQNADKLQVGQQIKFPDGEQATKPAAPATGDTPAPTTPRPGTDAPSTPAPQPGSDAPAAPSNPKTGTDAPAAPVNPQPPSDAPAAHSATPESGFMGFIHKAEAVAGDIASGAIDEVANHPGEVLKNVAIGAVAALGAALLAPEVVMAAAVVGVAVAGYEVATHAGGWVHAGDVVANQEGHTAAEIQAAHDTLHGVGGGATEIAAGFLGGGIGTVGVKIAGRIFSSEAGALTGAAGRAGSAEATGGRTATTGESAEATGAKTSGKVEAAEGTSPIKGVKIESPEEGVRTYEVEGKRYSLNKAPNQEWFYGKFPKGDMAAVKVHVNVDSAEDLARLQKVLIPFLKDNPEASRLAGAWKTFDPELGLPGREGFGPGPTGQEAKGFTIYAKTTAEAKELQALIDKELVNKGLGLPHPYNTGNVDIIEGQSGRVGTVRDHFPSTSDSTGALGARLDDTLAQRIEAQFGDGKQLSAKELRAVEQETGIAPKSLAYDKNGKLMMKLSQYDRPRNGQVYVSEMDAGTAHGSMTDRPALYALSQYFGWNPANG